MKNSIFATILALFSFSIAFGQAIYTFNGTTNANWNTASNWSCAGIGCTTNNRPPNPLPSTDEIIINAQCNLTINYTISNGGTLTVNSGSFRLRINSNNTLTNSGEIINNGTFNTQGTLGVIVNEALGMITNNGTINNNGSITNNGDFDNLSVINNNNIFTNSNTGSITNGDDAADSFDNNGTLILNGFLTNFDATALDNTGGTIEGTGTITGDFTNAGTVSPAGSGALSTLTIDGDFTNTGTVSIEINETPSSDVLNVTGTANLGGTLEVLIYTLGEIQPGQDFIPVTAPTVIGTFATYIYPGIPSDWTQVTNPTDFTFSYSNLAAPLPIELVAFAGRKVGSQVQLYWETATEKNNALMEIERSADGQVFSKIGEKKPYGDGNSLALQRYEFTDYQPLPGLNYYRLRQLDLGGKDTYHKTIAILFDEVKNEEGVRVFPSPAAETLHFALAQETTATGTIRVLDMSGRAMLQLPLPIGIQQDQMDISSLPQGQYILSIQAGRTSYNIKFAKL